VNGEINLKKLFTNKENRIRIFSILIIIFYLIILVKILNLYFEGDAKFNLPKLGESHLYNQKKYNILDRSGNLIATTVETYNFYISPAKAVFIDEMLEKLSRIFPEAIEDEEIIAKLKSKKNRLVLIKREITEEQKNAIINAGIEASEFEKSFARLYPYGRIFSHIVGYVNSDLEGVAGLERNFNQKLHYEDIKTSLDARIQTIVHFKMSEFFKEYKPKAGFGIVANSKTGEVISLVSLPDFNPKEITNPNDDNMKNVAISSSYQLGSVFKILTIAMGLQSGIKEDKLYKVDLPIKVDNTFTLKDEYVRKPQLNMAEILAFSSNVGSVQILEDVGLLKQKKFFEEMGVFKAPKIEISPYEIGAPIYKTGNWAKSMHYTATYGYGIAISPIQFVNIVRTIIGTGKKGNLTLLKGGETDGEEILFSPETMQKMQKMLKEVIRIGTAKYAKVNGYEICGKSSTSLKYDNKLKIWSKEKKMVSFLGFFPCSNPRYIIYFGFDEPQKTEKDKILQGGFTVAPLASELISEIAPLLNVKPDGVN
jgi:cell division protein FtsI (penicillin-binding protein 3)